MVDWSDDHVSILNLYARYNVCSDAGDAKGFAECFTRAGTMTNGTGVWSGREKLADYKSAEYAPRRDRIRRHWNDNLILEEGVSGEVHGSCYLRAYEGAKGEEPQLTHHGVYEDVLVREDGRWCFQSRKLSLD